VRNLVKSIHLAGGTCYLIGGAIIDQIQGVPVKDWDIEVHNLTMSKLKAVLIACNYPCNEVGASFGVIKTQAGGRDIDLSIPRRENKIGKGHKDFYVKLDHTMTPMEAGRRRDLTMNSMYKNMLTGELIDPFNGLKDFQEGVLRATDPYTFVEDPLRVLRIMQLLPRKGKRVHSRTLYLCGQMRNDFQYLPKERIFEEFVKLLTKTKRPSVGLEFLREVKWIEHFPELHDLIGCEQHPDHHPEGDAWVHTLKVLDCAAHYRNKIPEEWQLAYMFGALLHDVGKPSTTNIAAGWTAYGHDAKGEPLAYEFMKRITDDKKLIDRVCRLVKNHMRPGQLTHAEAGDSGWKRLHNKIRLDVVGYLSKADSLSRYHDTLKAILQDHLPSEISLQYFKKFGEFEIKPILMGRHLIERGHCPGPEFKVILDRAYELQLDGEINLKILYKEVVNENQNGV